MFQDEKSDVYSYSIIVYEILINKLPFDTEKYKDFDLMKKIMEDEIRPTIDQMVPSNYRELLERCMSFNPDQRPSFSFIVSQLENNFITDEINKGEFEEYKNQIYNHI